MINKKKILVFGLLPFRCCNELLHVSNSTACAQSSIKAKLSVCFRKLYILNLFLSE